MALILQAHVCGGVYIPLLPTISSPLPAPSVLCGPGVQSQTFTCDGARGDKLFHFSLDPKNTIITLTSEWCVGGAENYRLQPPLPGR